MDLDPKLKEEINNLPKNFNIVLESDNVDYLASRRVEVSKYWIPKLLKYSFYINVVTLVFILISVFFLSIKPEPKFFATTPNGKIIPLETVKLQNNSQGQLTVVHKGR